MTVAQQERIAQAYGLSATERHQVALGLYLKTRSYGFITPTPLTHQRYLDRSSSHQAETLRDVFGWNLPFQEETFGPELVELMQRADVLKSSVIDGRRVLRSTVRFSSTLEGGLYMHTAFGEQTQDRIFFGPDSYRFVRWLDETVDRGTRVVDIGCGSGIGGLHLRARFDTVVLADLNPGALRTARVNAAIAGLDSVQFLESDVLSAFEGEADWYVSNPPYMMDPTGPTYRDGGRLGGAELSVRIARQVLERLEPGQGLSLYTATTFVDGRDTLREAVAPLLDRSDVAWRYTEIDPDVFGEELLKPGYEAVERIAVIGLLARRVGD